MIVKPTKMALVEAAIINVTPGLWLASACEVVLVTPRESFLPNRIECVFPISPFRFANRHCPRDTFPTEINRAASPRSANSKTESTK